MLDGFPKDLLEAKEILAPKEGETLPDFVAPALKGSWSVESADGQSFRDGYLFPLANQLGANGRKEAQLLCDRLKHETLARGLHKIRLGADGSLVGWGRTSQAA